MTPTDKRSSAVDGAREWRSGLSGSVGALLLFTTVSGLVIYLLPFSVFTQLNVLLHTVVGLLMLPPVLWFLVRHWQKRRKGNFSHYQLLGYLSLGILTVCIGTGLLLTWQGMTALRINYTADTLHLLTGFALAAFLLAHLGTVVVRKGGNSLDLRQAQRHYYVYSSIGCTAILMVAVTWSFAQQSDLGYRDFTSDYNWSFGADRPFAPSLARLDYDEVTDRTLQQVSASLPPAARQQFALGYAQLKDPAIGLTSRIRLSLDSVELDQKSQQQIDRIMDNATDWVRTRGAVEPKLLAGSKGCGVSGCHEEIYREWLPSAHRYSSMDDMFQRVQVLMAAETSPEHTRFCAGCHDPISLFSGAKNAGNITLSSHGSNEGTSCMVCHSIVQADVQGNGDYTVRLPDRYLFEFQEDGIGQVLSHFLIRTYPQQHISSLARPLYKTEEFCAACHKQYMDKEVNTDIGKVQGQNQYDSWKNSRWYHEDNPEQTVGCRECHMPLQDSQDPAWGDNTDYNRSPDDHKHRSHRFLASNQYIPVLQKLEGAEEHVALTEKWLRGEIDIPEIANKWTEGPVVRLDILAPETAIAGEELSLRVLLTNNKTGHDFPTGPLDMIESWIEVRVDDDDGNTVYHTGTLNEDGTVDDSQVVFKSDGFDRKGELIDRHNLWDMVGASYKRALYPGVTDAVEVQLTCPSMSRPRIGGQGSGERAAAFSVPVAESHTLTVTATLWYRKANPEFLDRVYGTANAVRSPATAMSQVVETITVTDATPP